MANLTLLFIPLFTIIGIYIYDINYQKDQFSKQQNFTINLERLYYKQILKNIPNNDYEFTLPNNKTTNIFKVATLLKLTDTIPKSYIVDTINGKVLAKEIILFNKNNDNHSCIYHNLYNAKKLSLNKIWDNKIKDSFYDTYYENFLKEYDTYYENFLKECDTLSFNKIILFAATIDCHDFSMENILLYSSNPNKIEFRLANPESDKIDYELFKYFNNTWLRNAFDKETKELYDIINGIIYNIESIQTIMNRSITVSDIGENIRKWRNIVF